MTEWYSIVWIYHNWFTHSSSGWRLGCFCLWTIANSAMNICIWVFVRTPVFNYFTYIPRGGAAGLSGNSTFNFLRNHWTVFQSGCTIVHPFQPWRQISISPHPWQPLLPIFLNIAIIVGTKRYLIVTPPQPWVLYQAHPMCQVLCVRCTHEQDRSCPRRPVADESRHPLFMTSPSEAKEAGLLLEYFSSAH